MALMEPLPDRPTNADLAKGIMQLHTCLEEHRSGSTRQFSDLNSKVENVTIIVDDLKVDQKLLVRAFSLVDDAGNPKQGKDKTIATTPLNEVIRKLILTTGGSLSAVLIIWKTGWTIYPAVWQGLKLFFEMAIK